MKRIFLFLVATVFATALSAAEYKYNRDIVYRSDDDYASTMCRMDIATPDGATDAPVIVWFHGGGLTSGKREIPAALLNGQYVVVGVGMAGLLNCWGTKTLGSSRSIFRASCRHSSMQSPILPAS